MGLIGSYWVRKKKGYATSQARHAVKRDATGDHVGSRWALSDSEAEEVKVATESVTIYYEQKYAKEDLIWSHWALWDGVTIRT